MSRNEYIVGYKKPPLHSRFQKGNSGNPGGRRKPVAANIHQALVNTLARRVTVAGEEGEERMSLLEALVGGMVKKAREGDVRCLKLVLEGLGSLDEDGLLELAERSRQTQAEELKLLRAQARSEAAEETEEGGPEK